MKCLVVVAHPLPDSLCRSLARLAAERLEAAGHEGTVEDLNGSGFAPALTEAERRSYYAAAFDASAVAGEAARGASPEQLAAARSAYVSVSEAEMVNHAARPRACAAAERAALKERMGRIRAGQFDQP